MTSKWSNKLCQFPCLKSENIIVHGLSFLTFLSIAPFNLPYVFACMYFLPLIFSRINYVFLLLWSNTLHTIPCFHQNFTWDCHHRMAFITLIQEMCKKWKKQDWEASKCTNETAIIVEREKTKREIINHQRRYIDGIKHMKKSSISLLVFRGNAN